MFVSESVLCQLAATKAFSDISISFVHLENKIFFQPILQKYNIWELQFSTICTNSELGLGADF